MRIQNNVENSNTNINFEELKKYLIKCNKNSPKFFIPM